MLDRHHHQINTHSKASAESRPAQRRTTPTQRWEILQLLAQSGQTTAAFCRERGLAYGSVSAWRRKEERQRNSTTPQDEAMPLGHCSEQTKRSQPTPIQFLEVFLTKPSEPDRPSQTTGVSADAERKAVTEATGDHSLTSGQQREASRPVTHQPHAFSEPAAMIELVLPYGIILRIHPGGGGTHQTSSRAGDLYATSQPSQPSQPQSLPQPC
jgi:transposase-like protein